MLRTCFLSSFVKIHSAVAVKKTKNDSANHRPGRPSWMTDQQKTTNLVENVEVLLSVKFRQNLFSGFGGKVKNVKVYAIRWKDGRRKTRYDDSSLEPSAQVSLKKTSVLSIE